MSLLLLCGPALIGAHNNGSAAETGSPTAPLGVIIPLICYFRRKKPIGGWLLYFFCSVFGGAIVTVIFVAAGNRNYLPTSWNDHVLYSLFLASAVPGIVVEGCLIVAAIALLRVRSWHWVVRIRWILAADIVAGLVAASIDVKFFPGSPEDLFLDVYTLIFPLVFLPYMLRSERVRQVFLSRDWAGGARFPGAPDPSPQHGAATTESELGAMRNGETQHQVSGSDLNAAEDPRPSKAGKEESSLPEAAAASGATEAGPGRGQRRMFASLSSSGRTYVLALMAILVLAVSYYLVISLPANERARLEFEREKFRALQSEKADRDAQEKSEAEVSRQLKDACFSDAETAYWEYVKLNGKPVPGKQGTYLALTSVWDAAAARKRDLLAECQMRYGRQ